MQYMGITPPSNHFNSTPKNSFRLYGFGSGRRMNLSICYGVLPLCYGGVVWAVHNASNPAASEPVMLASLGRALTNEDNVLHE